MARLFFTVSGRTNIAASTTVTVCQLKAAANTPVVICQWAGGGAVLGRYELCGQSADTTGTAVVKNKLTPNHGGGGESIQCAAAPALDATQEAAIVHTPFMREETKGFDVAFPYLQEPLCRGGNRIGLRITNSDTVARDFTWTMTCEE